MRERPLRKCTHSERLGVCVTRAVTWFPNGSRPSSRADRGKLFCFWVTWRLGGERELPLTDIPCRSRSQGLIRPLGYNESEGAGPMTCSGWAAIGRRLLRMESLRARSLAPRQGWV